MKPKAFFYYYNKKLYHHLKLILGILIIYLIVKIYILEILDSKNNYKDRDDFILESLPIYNHTHAYNNAIFWCWLQGKINIPIVKACLNSIIKNNKGNKIIIINENNMHKYVHFPPYILQKFHKRLMSKTHFSDLLRLELLMLLF